MSIISRAANTYFAFRFLQNLVTPWKKLPAYKLGIIDEKGNRIKKPETDEEKTVYSYFHRLVFNIKRLLEKLPNRLVTLSSYAAAFWLIKEQTGLSEYQLQEILEDAGYTVDARGDNIILSENFMIPGKYKILEDIYNKDGNISYKKNQVINLDLNQLESFEFFNNRIYLIDEKTPITINQLKVSKNEN